MISLNVKNGLLLVRLHIWEEPHIRLAHTNIASLESTMGVEILRKVSRSTQFHLLVEAHQILLDWELALLELPAEASC